MAITINNIKPDYEYCYKDEGNNYFLSTLDFIHIIERELLSLGSKGRRITSFSKTDLEILLDPEKSKKYLCKVVFEFKNFNRRLTYQIPWTMTQTHYGKIHEILYVI